MRLQVGTVSDKSLARFVLTAHLPSQASGSLRSGRRCAPPTRAARSNGNDPGTL